MSRILLAWELGHNLGHLSRILPIARELKQRGHTVLVAARDIANAARSLSPLAIPFVQAPQATIVPRETQLLASYADILWHQGWGDVAQLVGLLQSWITLFRLYRPDRVILDHSPTAALAAHCLGTTSAWVGTGFEIPPQIAPFPAFPGVHASRAGEIELKVLENTNGVLAAMRFPKLDGLRDLFAVPCRWLTTYKELDHYGPREGENYIGMIDDIGYGATIGWTATSAHRVFTYLRPQTPNHACILSALAALPIDVVCYAPGMATKFLESIRRPGFTYSMNPVLLERLLADAHLCVSYAPSGTVATTLLRGIPQLCAPPHLEAKLTALCVEQMGAGISLKGTQTQAGVQTTIERLLESNTCSHGAKLFASRYKVQTASSSLATVVGGVEAL
jgi:hypothetical protein